MARTRLKPDWRQVVEALPEALFVLSIEGKILESNAAALRLCGRTREDLLGLRVSDLFDAREGRFDEDELPVVRAGVSVQRERVLERSDGFRLPVLVSAALSEPAAEGAFIVCQCVDITERRAAEEEVVLGRANLRAMIDNSEQMIFSIDAQGRLATFNRVFADQLLGWTGAMAEQGLDLLRLMPTGARSEARSHFDRALGGEAFAVEVPVRSGGGERLVAFSLNPVRAQPGSRVEGVAVYGRDVTDERLSADLLRRARDEAEAAARARAHFLTTMSHEIRTPLNGVIGMVELLGATGLSAEQQEVLEIIRSSSRLLTGVLNDILDLSRLDAGGLLLDARPMWIPDILHPLVGAFGYEAGNKGLRLGCHIDEGIGLFEHLGDSLRIRQVVGNLLSNAVKFCERGEVDVRAVVLTTEEAPLTVRFEVRDTGIGIRPENVDRLFEPFVQEDLSTTRRFGGSGLGLSIARRLVDLMGGRISVESAPGLGSVFRVDLPLPVAGRHKAPAALSPDRGLQHAGSATLVHGRTGSASAGPERDNTSLRVLVAEDNAVNRLVAGRLLRTLGIEATMVENGRDALEAVGGRHFDLVFLDVEMPILDGLETARRLRAEHSGAIPYLVALTAHAMQGYEQVCLDAGMDDYLAKPVRTDDLASVLSRYWAARSGSKREEEA